jgi:hypothetical protein
MERAAGLYGEGEIELRLSDGKLVRAFPRDGRT